MDRFAGANRRAQPVRFDRDRTLGGVRYPSRGLERLVTSTPSVDDRPARLSVGVVGAGRVGVVLAAALARAGHRVVAVSAVSDASRRRADEMLPGTPVLPPPEVIAAAELVLLTVPDDVLPGLVDGLAAAGDVRTGQLLVHTSGRYGAGVLDPATRRGALPLALHPAMTFTGRREDLARLAGACFGITAPDPLRPIGEALVVEMGGDPQWVEEELPPALPRGAGRPARTTSPPWSTTRSTCSAGAASRSPSGCSHPCSAPRSTTRCGPATRP